MGRGELVIVDRQGVERSLRDARDVYRSPRFSPDGMRVALGIGQPPAGQLWILEMEQEILTPLTFEANNVYPLWSWEGEQVLFASDRAGARSLFRKPADGSGVAEPLLIGERDRFPASLSRDGRYLIYREVSPVTGRDIWVLPLDGDREPWAFTQTPAHLEHAPVLSPDGRWLAYVSDLSGRNEVYVNAFPGPGGRRPVSVEGGTEPVWSRDGSELFYRKGAALLVAAVETTPDFRVWSREVLFEGPYAEWVWHSNYDVHPDGDRFVMIKTGRD
jgi:Tol biopolymer transport system component